LKYSADRLKGIVIAYIWALLTNRHFSIDIQHPCPLSELFEPNEVSWNLTIKCHDYYTIKSMINNHHFSTVLVDKMNDFKYLDEFQSIDLTNYFSNVNLIILKANLDYINSLSKNYLLHEKLFSLGFVDEIKNFKMSTIFRVIYNKLFKLKPELEKKFNRFKILAKRNNETKMFCAQIRIGTVVGDRKFSDRNNTKIFWDFIRNTIMKNEDNYKLFVTTDTESVAEEAIMEFGEDNVLIIDGLYNHLDVGPKSARTCKMYYKTILDMHAFQLCDKVVVSRGGYGLMGNFLREYPFNEFYRYTELFNDKTESKIRSIIKFLKIKNIEDLEENVAIETAWVKTLK
jgi:hypothetical protein